MFLAKALPLSLLMVWLVQLPAESHGKHNATCDKPDFYVRKLKTYFAASDANKDGLISKNDYNDMAYRFIFIVHLSRWDAKMLLYKKVPKIWNTFYHDKAGKGNPADRDEMIAAIKGRRSGQKFASSVKRFVEQEFDICDLDNNGKLSQYEHTIYMKCRGVNPEDEVKSFTAIDANRNGCIERREFSSMAANFFTTDNEHDPSQLFYGPLV